MENLIIIESNKEKSIEVFNPVKSLEKTNIKKRRYENAEKDLEVWRVYFSGKLLSSFNNLLVGVTGMISVLNTDSVMLNQVISGNIDEATYKLISKHNNETERHLFSLSVTALKYLLKKIAKDEYLYKKLREKLFFRELEAIVNSKTLGNVDSSEIKDRVKKTMSTMNELFEDPLCPEKTASEGKKYVYYLRAIGIVLGAIGLIGALSVAAFYASPVLVPGALFCNKLISKFK